MIKVDVNLDSDLLFRIQSQLNFFMGNNGAEILPFTKMAFDQATKLIQKSWQNWALGGSLANADDIKSPSPRLANSIRIRRINDFNASIETDFPQMERIQRGTPEFDMKESYPYGRKSRVSKKGIPYLIIPFRWGTPNGGGKRAHFGNTIPLEAYRILQAKQFKRTMRTNKTHIELNAKGEKIERHEYSTEAGVAGWGNRLNDESLGNVNGMVKMKTNSQSAYFTFRVISAKSPAGSWIRKEVPANNVVSAVEASTRSDVEKMISDGLMCDLDF